MKNYQFYHIYPLGMLDKLNGNNELNLLYLNKFIPHLKELNINALYIGPLFESKYHGYDTIDYNKIDFRLGTNNNFIEMVNSYHNSKIDIIIDCVFNHASRDFFAFKDLLYNKWDSRYRDWFYTDFSRNNNRNDGFSYHSWDGHDELVKLNLENTEVSDYLINIAKNWVYEFDIDGLRLDAADVMSKNFMKRLNTEMKSIKKDFYIVGEMVHGNYMELMKETGIDSVTNYQCYKGLYSSLNDKNYHEIGHSFNNLLGKNGLIDNKYLYNFVDNHDVNRVASVIKNQKHLYPLYLMMYTMKGYTSIYYKSEFETKGKRTHNSDNELRQPFLIEELNQQNELFKSIKKFSEIRNKYDLFAFGDYEQIILESTLIAYKRSNNNKNILVIINSDDDNKIINQKTLNTWKNKYNLSNFDILNEEKLKDNQDLVIFSNWGRILE
jgi:glycosidase